MFILPRGSVGRRGLRTVRDSGEQNAERATNLVVELEDISEIVLDPHLVAEVKSIRAADDFWLGLFAKDLRTRCCW